MQVGPFPAHDFYGDGSLYLLDTPGHWPGHMCALARTTPNTFGFLGGDICHFAGDFRPSEGMPLPQNIPEGAFGPASANAKRRERYPMPCPCTFFTDHHPQKSISELNEQKVGRTPFYRLSTDPHSSYKDPPLASSTLEKMRDYFDTDPNVLVCLAHDSALLDHLPVFNDDPNESINDWQSLGIKEKCHWGWLKELPRYDEAGRVIGPGMRDENIVEGTWKEGQRVK